MSAASRSLGPGANDQQAVTNHGPIGTVSADFIKLHGKHTLNFGWTGVEQIFGQHPYYQTTIDFTGQFTAGPNPLSGSGVASGNGVAEMLLGDDRFRNDSRLYRQSLRIEPPLRPIHPGRLEADAQSDIESGFPVRDPDSVYVSP